MESPASWFTVFFLITVQATQHLPSTNISKETKTCLCLVYGLWNQIYNANLYIILPVFCSHTAEVFSSDSHWAPAPGWRSTLPYGALSVCFWRSRSCLTASQKGGWSSPQLKKQNIVDIVHLHTHYKFVWKCIICLCVPHWCVNPGLVSSRCVHRCFCCLGYRNRSQSQTSSAVDPWSNASQSAEICSLPYHPR